MTHYSPPPPPFSHLFFPALSPWLSPCPPSATVLVVVTKSDQCAQAQNLVALVGQIWSDLASSGRIWWRFQWVSLSIGPDVKSVSLQNTAHLSSDPERHLVVDRPVYPGHGRIRGEHAFGMTTPVRHARERGYVGAGDQRIPEVRGFGHCGWGRIGSKSQMMKKPQKYSC